MSQSREKRLDPVTFEILHHKLWQITNEMSITLSRVTGSPVTIDAKDYATGLFRADGDLMMIGCGVLFHAVTIPYGIKHVLAKYSEDPGIAEGDVFLTNDPYVCAVHAADMYVLTPIYYAGELVAWAGSMTHLVDIGGIDPGGMSPRATDVWQEGLRLPGLKVVERGKIRRDIWDSVLNMVRDPGMVGLDLRGQIAAGRVAGQRLTELIATYGLDTYWALTQEVIRHAEARLKARLSELPDGTWQTRVYYDDDGMTDRIYQIIIKMTKEKDTLTFDLTGTSEQAPSFINCGVKGAEAAVFGSVAPLVAYDIPWSQGVINVLKVTAPEGTLVNPRFPAPSSLGTVGAADALMTGVQEVVAKMFMASDKYREDFTAMWGMSGGGVVVAGIGQNGTYAVVQLMDSCGTGAGARSYADGVNTGGKIYIPEIMVPNAETFELAMPILYLFRREAMDSGGPGKWRGGCSIEYALTLHDAPQGRLMVTHHGRGLKAPITLGLFGGYPAANLRKEVVRNTNTQEKLKNGRVPQGLDELEQAIEPLPANGVFQLGERDVLCITMHGGGGYGDPLDRDPELVRRDVADKYVSPQAAQEVYGVLVAPGSLEVDYQKTEAARARIRRDRLEAKAVKLRKGAVALRIHEYLELQDKSSPKAIVCRKCYHNFCPATENYKDYAVVGRRPPSRAGPRHTSSGQFVMREFYCPGCATLLDVEICVEGAPFLWDASVHLPPESFGGSGGASSQAASDK